NIEALVSVFVVPPSLEVLEKRLRGRGTDDESAIERRLQEARVELEERPYYDHVIVNADLDQAVRDTIRCLELSIERP
ncbi:MAG: guanylate kinase, partial [Planctomycetota bacterium]